MRPIDIAAIEQQARALRAAEIQRIQGLFARAGRCARQSDRRQHHRRRRQSSAKCSPPLFVESAGNDANRVRKLATGLGRLNDAARALFSWNPQDRRP